MKLILRFIALKMSILRVDAAIIKRKKVKRNLYPYYAAGYTTLICYIVFSLYHYYFMRKICKKEFDGEMPYKTSVD